MFCNKCGTKSLEGATFCQKCGAKLIAEDTSKQASSPTPIKSEQLQALDNQVDSPKKRKSKKIFAGLAAVALVFVVILIVGNSIAVQNVKKEAVDAIANVADSGNKYVQMVKNGYRENNPDLTYDKAFSAFFGTPRWKYFEGDGGQNVVEFTGDCTYQDVPVKARLQFVVDEENGTFNAEYLAFNEVPQSLLIMASLIEKAFEGVESTSSLASGEVMYNGISLSQFFKLSADEVIATLGTPSEYNEAKVFYDDIDFYTDNGRITSAESFSPGKFTINGTPLEKNRAELIDLLGNPSSEGEGGSGYEMSFEQDNYKLTILTGDKESVAWRVFVYPIKQQGADDNTSLNSGEVLFKGKPVVNWLGARSKYLYDVFGAPVRGTPVNGDLYNGGEYYGYDGIAFVIDYQTDGIGWIIGTANSLELNGVTLDKTRTEFIDTFGEPSYEYLDEEFSGDYIIEYLLWGEPRPIVVTIALPDSKSKARDITISPYEDGISDEEYQDITNNSASSSSELLTADGKEVSVGSLVYAKQNIFGVSANYVRGYVTSIDNDNSVNVMWDTVLENRLWAFDECAIFSDSNSVSGYSYYSNASNEKIQLIGIKFKLPASELYSKMP